MAETDASEVIRKIRCPSCGSAVYNPEKICPFCSSRLNVRICPYCKRAIPQNEDPCHVCGHLEPAEQPGENANVNPGIRYYFHFHIILFLVFGVLMIIWPDANPEPGYECYYPDTEDCFIPYLVWSRPGGIALVLFGLISLGREVISRANQNT